METTNIEPIKEEIKALNAPVKSMFILLGLAWVLFLIPISGLALVGWCVNLAVTILSIVCLCKSEITKGVTGLVLSIVASPVVFIIGAWLFAILLLKGVK